MALLALKVQSGAVSPRLGKGLYLDTLDFRHLVRDECG